MKSPQAHLQMRLIKDRAFIAIISIFSGIVLLPLVFIFAYVFKRGIKAINWGFFTQLPVPVGEVGGGVLNAIVGSLIIVSVAALIAIPLGILSGVFLVEKSDHKFAGLSRLCIDTFQGTPSIVMGIIAYSWIVRPLGQFSAFPALLL
jgi:phosphate transport system permease protein